jgi:hypothetical protein
MVVASEAKTVGEKELREDWPITEGITAGTTKQKTDSASLEADEKAMESSWGCV